MLLNLLSGVAAVFIWIGSSALAIEVNPTEEDISRSIEEGKKDSSRKGATTNTVGEASRLCNGYGFLQTKLWSIREASKANQKKMRPTRRKEIEDVLALPTMLITFVYCSDDSRKSDDHMVIKQGEQIIQPVLVSNSTPEYLSGSSVVYVHTVQAHFKYTAFDPKAESILIVIPDDGKRIEYAIKLSEYP